MNHRPLVIYHGNCADGFTSAWLANQWYASESRPKDWYVDLHAGIYGEEPPNVKGRHVLILDFSYPPEQIIEMAKEAQFIVVIDHHESAVRRFDGVLMPDNVRLLLDVSRSGAFLTSLYFWPGEDPTHMVALVDDRDRWQFRFHESRPFASGMFSYGYSLENWNLIANNVEGVAEEGEAIERKHMKDIRELLPLTCRSYSHGGMLVACANLHYMLASDAGHLMLEQYPGVDFAATYYIDSKGDYVFSLRSRKDLGPNVAKIAEEFGGGGHPNASGFRVSRFPFVVEVL